MWEAVPSSQVILNDLLHGMMRVTKCMNDIPAKGMLLLPQVYPFQSAVSRNAWYTPQLNNILLACFVDLCWWVIFACFMCRPMHGTSFCLHVGGNS